MTSPAITQTFIPGPRLIDGTDLNNLVAQANAAFAISGAYPAVTALNTVGAGTITAAGIVSTITSRGGGQSATAFTDTTDTAAAIISAMGTSAGTNASFLWAYENTTDATATIAGGATVTLTGNSVIPAGTWATYLVTKTSSTAVSIAFLYAGALSPLPVSKVTTETSYVTLTVSGLTGAQLCSVILPTAASGSVFPSATDFVAAEPNCRIGMSHLVQIINTSVTKTCTLTGLTGVTLAGTSPTLVQPAQTRMYNLAYPSLSSVQLTGIASTTL